MEVIRRKTQTQSSNWVFTLNNYTEDEVAAIGIICDDPKPFPNNDKVVKGLACSAEIGGKNNTPHLQGFLQLSGKGMKILYSLKQVQGSLLPLHLCFSASALKHFLFTFF